MAAYGYLAEFKNPADLMKAAEALRDEGYKEFDTYSPFPIHGMDAATGIKDTGLGWIVLLGGLIGAVAGMSLQSWVSIEAYPMIISGKPDFSWPAFIPVTFELMVLFSAFAAVFGMLGLNKLPQWYHQLFTVPNFAKATSHGFFVSVEVKDKQFDKDKTKAFLEKIGGENITYVA